MRKPNKATSGVTMLELLMTIFVLLIGIVGVMSLFPVGVKLGHDASDDVISAMTAQNALAAVRIQTGLLGRVRSWTADNTCGDVLGWANDQSTGVEGISGTINKVGDGLAKEKIEPSVAGGSGRTLNVKDSDQFGCALMLMTSGKAIWKLYRLDKNSTFTQFGSGATVSPCTDFPGDNIEEGDSFRLIGARASNREWATVPKNFFRTPPLPTYDLGPGAAKGYGYLVIVTRLHDGTNTYGIDILVYKGYDRHVPPEGNQPPIACYTTILSGDMLR